MPLQCTGSRRTKWVRGRPTPLPEADNKTHREWVYTTADCQDCGTKGLILEIDRFGRQVLPRHEPATAAAVREALSASPNPQTEARHLAQIREALDD